MYKHQQIYLLFLLTLASCYKPEKTVEREFISKELLTNNSFKVFSFDRVEKAGYYYNLDSLKWYLSSSDVLHYRSQFITFNSDNSYTLTDSLADELKLPVKGYWGTIKESSFDKIWMASNPDSIRIGSDNPDLLVIKYTDKNYYYDAGMVLERNVQVNKNYYYNYFIPLTALQY